MVCLSHENPSLQDTRNASIHGVSPASHEAELLMSLASLLTEKKVFIDSTFP